MSPHVLRGAAFGVGLAAALAFAAPAMASYSASVDGTTLRLAGDGASDKVAMVADPTTLFIDVGEDGTTDFSFARSAFTTVSVTAGGGDDEVRIQGLLDGVTVDGGAGNDSLFGGGPPPTPIGGPREHPGHRQHGAPPRPPPARQPNLPTGPRAPPRRGP